MESTLAGGEAAVGAWEGEEVETWEEADEVGATVGLKEREALQVGVGKIWGVAEGA